MKRISGYISDELYSEIEEIAEREQRKVTPMISLLLQLAVKEKNRKRNAKKVHIGYNPTDIHKNYGERQGVFQNTTPTPKTLRFKKAT